MSDPTEAEIRATAVASAFDPYRSMKQETTMNKPWAPTAGMPAMVMVEIYGSSASRVRTSDAGSCWISNSHLTEPPTPITPQERAVVNAAKRVVDGLADFSILVDAVKVLRTAESPPDPKAELLAAAKKYRRTMAGFVEAVRYASSAPYPWQGEPIATARLDAAIRAMEADDE